MTPTPDEPIVLCVDYDDADDLVADYDQTVSHGSTWIAYARPLAEGTSLRLVLSFPGLCEPIRIGGVVRAVRREAELMLEVELAASSQAELAATIARIRARDKSLVKRPLRVLIVEDNPHVAELICNGMSDRVRGLGAEVAIAVATASDGREALELLQTRKFDAMIVDVYLPVLDGPHLITAVRGRAEGSRVRIIALSAGGDSAHAAAMTAGADVFIDKPIRLRDMIRTIRTLMKLEGAS
jgi:CheY-like chemotaxis protein